MRENTNETGETHGRPNEAKWGGFETVDGRLVIYEAGTLGGWLVSTVRIRVEP